MIFQLHTWTLTESRNNWCLNFPGQLRNDPTGAARSVQWRSATCNWREQRLYTKGFNWRRLLECLSLRKLTGPTFSKPPIFKGKVLGQAKLVQATCVRHPWWRMEAKRAIVFTYFFSFSSFFLLLSFYACFSPTSGKLPWLKICVPQYFGIRNFRNFLFFYAEKKWSSCIFLLFTASVRSRSLGQPLVSGVSFN